MKIVIVGTSYVGLVTAAIFSKFGYQVVGLDIDREKIARLKRGIIPFYEPGLKELIEEGLGKGNLFFSDRYDEAIAGARIVFICVGTPSEKNGEIDLSFVKKACEMVAEVMTAPLLVVIKSTVPPGIDAVVKPLMTRITKFDYEIATCPEFLREGNAIEDALCPDRVIIGANSRRAASTILSLHRKIRAPKYVFDINSAQMVKYSANAFLANKISFANQIANLCDFVDADSQKVMLGLGLDRRIGQRFLNPGLGFGGSCFPKDTAALCYLAKKYHFDLQMVRVAIKINKRQVGVVFSKLENLVGDLRGKTIAVLGIAFKPGTDDLRQSQVLPLIKKILKAGGQVKVFDPIAMPAAKKKWHLPIKFAANVYGAVKGVDGLVLATEWPEFKELQFERIKRLMRQPVIVDGRNLWEPEKLKKLGFHYLGVGRR